MPATLTASRTAAPLSLAAVPAAKPAGAPLSRMDDAVVVSAPCMACGAKVLGWGWVNLDGLGVLLHDTAEDSTPCPVARPFDWETGQPIAAAVAA